jgi:hypothetical protein
MSTRIRRFPQLDNTWRLVERGTQDGPNMPEEIAGVDCYIFQRAGGDKPTDRYTLWFFPVEKFWGTKENPR